MLSTVSSPYCADSEPKGGLSRQSEQDILLACIELAIGLRTIVTYKKFTFLKALATGRVQCNCLCLVHFVFWTVATYNIGMNLHVNHAVIIGVNLCMTLCMHNFV